MMTRRANSWRVLVCGLACVALGSGIARAAPVSFDVEVLGDAPANRLDPLERLDLQADLKAFAPPQFATASTIEFMMAESARSALAERLKRAVAFAMLQNLLDTPAPQGSFVGDGMGALVMLDLRGSGTGSAFGGQLFEALLGNVSGGTGRDAEATLRLRHAVLDSYDALAGVRGTLSSVQSLMAQYSPLATSLVSAEVRNSPPKRAGSDGELFNQVLRVTASVLEAIQDYYWLALILAAPVFLAKYLVRR